MYQPYVSARVAKASNNTAHPAEGAAPAPEPPEPDTPASLAPAVSHEVDGEPVRSTFFERKVVGLPILLVVGIVVVGILAFMALHLHRPHARANGDH